MSCKRQIDQLCLTSHKAVFVNLHKQIFFSMNEFLESLPNGTELKFPNLPAPSQGVERAVKLTTENSQIVYVPRPAHKHKQIGLLVRL